MIDRSDTSGTTLDVWLAALHRGELQPPSVKEPHALTFLASRGAFGRWVACRARVLANWRTRFCAECHREFEARSHHKRLERVRCDNCHDAYREEFSV